MIRRLVALAWLLALIAPGRRGGRPAVVAARRTCPPRISSSIPSTSRPPATARPWRGGRGRTARGTAAAPDGAWRRARPARRRSAPERSAPSGTVAVEAYAKTRAIALTDRAIGPANVGRTRLSVAFGSTSGSFGSQRRIVDEPSLDGVP